MNQLIELIVKKYESKLPIYFYQKKFDPRDYRDILIYNVKNLSTNVWSAHMYGVPSLWDHETRRGHVYHSSSLKFYLRYS